MSRQLTNHPYSIKSPIFTLHDRPAQIFQPIESLEARKSFLERIQETRDDAAEIMAGRRKLLISSTSWTPDEDFSLLLDALVSYSKSSKTAGSILPPISAIITGKGPEKDVYLRRIAELKKSGKLDNVSISTAFLPIEDYAKLLACADLGVCLHMSSSGVDLPMKVVDMFGAGLPVVGYSAYESWPELVTEDVNGRGFETALQLSNVLVELFGEKGQGKLETLRLGAVREGKRRWDEEWDGVAGRLLGFGE